MPENKAEATFTARNTVKVNFKVFLKFYSERLPLPTSPQWGKLKTKFL